MPHTRIRVAQEAGQTMTEYSVVLGVIVIGVIAAIGFFGAAVAQHIDTVVTTLGGVVS